MHIIKCVECGSERQSRWSNTKYCLPCRYLDNAKYIELKEMTTVCMGCETPFRPLKRNDIFCPECYPVSQNHPRGRCNLCERDDQSLLVRNLKICRECAYSAKKRPKFIAALTRKQKELKENPYVLPEGERPAEVGV